MNMRLCKETNRQLEQNQSGILVNVFFDNEAEQEELNRLQSIKPHSFNGFAK